MTFGNQGLINKDLSITSSILCIALSIDYTFEFFRSEPKRYHPKTLWRYSLPLLDVYELRAPKVSTVNAVNSRVKYTSGHQHALGLAAHMDALMVKIITAKSWEDPLRARYRKTRKCLAVEC